MNEFLEAIENVKESNGANEMQEMFKQKYEQALENNDTANAEFWKGKLDDLESSREQPADTEEMKLGYSSDYYKTEMANAIKNGNSIAYDNAKSNYANALVKEQTE